MQDISPTPTTKSLLFESSAVVQIYSTQTLNKQRTQIHYTYIQLLPTQSMCPLCLLFLNTAFIPHHEKISKAVVPFLGLQSLNYLKICGQPPKCSGCHKTGFSSLIEPQMFPDQVNNSGACL